VHPLDGEKPAVVFILARTDCPISNRYAPEVQRLMEEYSAHVDFWLVYPDPEESPGQIAQHVHDYGYRCGVLRDVTHQLVDLVGAEVTPEASVFSPTGRLVYSGRIDDRYADFGKTRPQATIHDLERVLLAIIAGDHVASTRTRAVGCPIPELL
jgi:AhpC/TSA family